MEYEQKPWYSRKILLLLFTAVSSTRLKAKVKVKVKVYVIVLIGIFFPSVFDTSFDVTGTTHKEQTATAKQRSGTHLLRTGNVDI